MKRMDLDCLTGNWPFYKIRYNTVEKLIGQHKRCGIDGGIVSSLEAIFYQDPYEAEVSLSQELAGTGYYHAMTLNPTLPAWKEDLKRCVEEFGVKAVRLTPGYHGYTLTDDVMDAVNDALLSYKLPLILTLRLDDDRTTWMFRPRPILMDEVIAFLKNYTELPTMVSFIRPAEVVSLAELLETRENLFVDIAGYMRGLFPIDDTYPIAKGKMVYGSGAAKNEMFSLKYVLDNSQLTDDQKNAVYSGESFLKYLP